GKQPTPFERFDQGPCLLAPRHHSTRLQSISPGTRMTNRMKLSGPTSYPLSAIWTRSPQLRDLSPPGVVQHAGDQAQEVMHSRRFGVLRHRVAIQPLVNGHVVLMAELPPDGGQLFPAL